MLLSRREKTRSQQDSGNSKHEANAGQAQRVFEDPPQDLSRKRAERDAVSDPSRVQLRIARASSAASVKFPSSRVWTWRRASPVPLSCRGLALVGAKAAGTEDVSYGRHHAPYRPNELIPLGMFLAELLLAISSKAVNLGSAVVFRDSHFEAIQPLSSSRLKAG